MTLHISYLVSRICFLAINTRVYVYAIVGSTHEYMAMHKCNSEFAELLHGFASVQLRIKRRKHRACFKLVPQVTIKRLPPASFFATNPLASASK